MGRRGGKNRAAQRSRESQIWGELTNHGNGWFWQSESDNERLFLYYRNIIMQMALSRFRWLNLPKTCDERFLEYTLLTQGVATIAFPTKIRGAFMSLQMTQQGAPNKYGLPKRWIARGLDGSQFPVDGNNGVVVYDNVSRFPILSGIELYANELTHIRMTKRMNRLHQQIPFILKGPQEYRQVMVDLYKQVAGGEPAVIATKNIDMVDFDVLSTGVQYIGEQLAQDETNVWNRIYTMLGIENSPFKLERQTDTEVRAQKSPTQLVEMASLSERRKAAEFLNDHFGDYLEEPIQVVWRQDNESENWNLLHNITSELRAVSE